MGKEGKWKAGAGGGQNFMIDTTMIGYRISENLENNRHQDH